MKTLQLGYKKVTILEMINKLECPTILIKLRDVQSTELSRLSTKNSRKKTLLNT